MNKQLFCLAFLFASLTACADNVPMETYVEDMAGMQENISNNASSINALTAEIVSHQNTIDELNTKISIQETQIMALELEKQAREEKIMEEKRKAEAAKAAKAKKPAAKPAPSISKITSKSLTEKQAYDEALRFYQIGKYQDAHRAFLAFRESYPNTKYASNAIYWSGEAYYAQEKYSQAILQFKDLLTRFPQDPKVPDALLKIALSYQKLNDPSSANIHATVLYQDWPNSDAAKKAPRFNLQAVSQ